MSALSLNSSHIGSLPPPNQQQVGSRHPSDQRLHTSAQSTGTVQHIVKNINRKASAGSVASRSSRRAGPLRVINGNAIPSHNASYTSLKLLENPGKHIKPGLRVSVSPAEAPLTTENIQSPQQGTDSSLLANDGTIQGIQTSNDRDKANYTSDGDSSSDWSSRAEKIRMQVPDNSPLPHAQAPSGQEPAIVVTEHGANPFKKLMNTLRPLNAKDKGTLSSRTERWSLDDPEDSVPIEIKRPRSGWLGGHRKASSWSSTGNTVMLRDLPITSGSKSPAQHSGRGSKLRFMRRSSRTSRGSNRGSVDIGAEIARVLDEEAFNRAVQRRKILDEFVSSEEGYINDLKVLTHVYLTILASTPNFPRLVRVEVERNLSEILGLHEDILYHMKLVQKTSDAQQKHIRKSSDVSEDLKGTRKGQRSARQSVDSSKVCRSITRTLTSGPQEAADIAKIFENMLSRFFIYEQYGARYESVLQLVAATSKAIPTWWAFERGIEALMNSLLPKRITEDGNKKGLTLEDLLIKPIQRVCRYPLLLTELLKNTQTDDDEDAEIEIRKVLIRLRETAHAINEATNDPIVQMKMERAWNLQDILTFPEDDKENFALRMLGHTKLCGTLFVVFQSQDKIHGQYMMCALFAGHLLLAVPTVGSKPFKVIAIINTTDTQIEQSDDGRGLQCYNALFCWKLIFGSKKGTYEMIMCACSAREESQWKAGLMQSSRGATYGPASSDHEFLYLGIKSLGSIFGQPGTLARRMAMQRTATVANRSASSQVIIRNTHSMREVQGSPKAPSASFNRSQSLLSTNHPAVLAPNRGDRVRLENAMEAVWSKEMLPFPGMVAHRGGGNLIRASKESVMRKISKASTNTQSSKHSVGVSGLADPFVENTSPGYDDLIDLYQQQTTPSASIRSNLERYETPESHVQERSHTEVPRKISFNITTRTRGASGATAIAETEEMEEPEQAGKSKKLLKAFSADGIRNWFS